MVVKMDSKISQIPFELNDGKTITLSDYGDKVVMIVNVASECGLTPQYEGLEKIYETYKDKGFVVVGFPANEFGAQEPGTNEEIKEFCTMKFGVKFPLAKKVVVKGDGQHDLFDLLTEEKPLATKKDNSFEDKLKGYGVVREKSADILWNFEKFLLDRNGNVAERFAPDITPEDPMVIEAIEIALNKK
jgi:glutathione peroxidase